MPLWLLLSSVLLFQEPLSATFVVLQAVRAHYPIILIHLLWLGLTGSQIYLGFILGKWGQRRFARAKFEAWIAEWTHKIDHLIGRKGEKAALIFFTLLTLPFIAGFVAAWFPISVWSVLLFSTLGSFLWYVQVWIGVYGADQFSSGLYSTIINVVVIGTLVSIPFAMWRKRLQGSAATGAPTEMTAAQQPPASSDTR
jgi:membrane protein YqaA with SNARE-associated domain